MVDNTTHKEQDDDVKSCPPGMVAKDGDCVPKGEAKKEDANAGASTQAGTDQGDTANPAPDTNTHDCPPGTSWDGDKCAPTGDQAGQPGGAGTGDASVPGKESWTPKQMYTMIEQLMASHSAYQNKLFKKFESADQRKLELLGAALGVPQYNAEARAYGVKSEASSQVDDSKYAAVYESTVVNPANWMQAIKKGQTGMPGSIDWTIKPDAYYKTVNRRWMNYGSNIPSRPITEANQITGAKLNDEGGQVKSEAFTVTGGDMPQVFSKQVYLIPGGRMRVPIRQFLDTQIITDSDRYNWYKVSGFDFDDVTNEGSEPTTEEAQTVTKVTATPSLKRANQTVKYSDIENAPFDLIEAFNRAAALGALDAEATEVLDTTYDAITPTNWVNGNSGAAITEDDTTNPTTLKQEGVYAAKRLIETQGGDTSPGSLVLFAHPKAVEELVLDTAADFFTGQNALHSTALGVLENRLGVDIVVTNAVAAQDNTTNDTYRNILAMKGSIGLAVAADLQIEAQRRPDLSAVKVGARHRIKGAVIDETMTCRISTAQ